MSTVQKTTTIDQAWLERHKNSKPDLSFDHVTDYSGRAIGALRELQVGQKGLNLGFELGQRAGFQPSATAMNLKTNLGIGVAALGIPRLPGATSDAIKSLAALAKNEDNGVPLQRKAATAVRDTTDAIAAYGFAATFIAPNPAIGNVAKVADFICDTTDLHLSVSDYTQAAKLEAKATGDAKEALRHSKNYYLLRIAKAVTAVVSGVLGLILLVTGAPLLPIVALIVLSLSATILAIYRDLYKDLGPYKVIPFDRPVHLAIV